LGAIGCKARSKIRLFGPSRAAAPEGFLFLATLFPTRDVIAEPVPSGDEPRYFAANEGCGRRALAYARGHRVSTVPSVSLKIAGGEDFGYFAPTCLRLIVPWNRPGEAGATRVRAFRGFAFLS
jgi:hypothetical protein